MSTSDPNTRFHACPRPPHERALERTRRALSLAALLFSASLPAACTGLTDTSADGGLGAVSADELEGELMAILRALFPDLSDAERNEMLQQLDAEQILALRDELEAARDAAVAYSDDLFKTAEERVAALEGEMQLPEVVADAARVARCWQELEEARTAVEDLYRRWEELEAKKGEQGG